MMKKTLLISSFIFLLMPMAAGAVSCGDTIYEDTVLTEDLVNCLEHMPGLTIGADNITLDCNEHLIDGVREQNVS